MRYILYLEVSLELYILFRATIQLTNLKFLLTLILNENSHLNVKTDISIKVFKDERLSLVLIMNR
jgi:hypothetical protein